MSKLAPKLFVIFLVVISIISFCSSPAKSATSEVEKLLAVSPDNMLSFIATSGADELKPSFDKTILGQIWNDPGSQTFYLSIKQELLKQIKQETADADDAKTFEAVMNFAELVLNRPIIIGAVRRDTKIDKFPVYGFAVLEAGARKAEIASAIAKLEALAEDGEIIEVKVGSHTMHGLKNDDGIPGYWGWIGKYFVFAINDDDGLAIKNLESQQSKLVPDYLSTVPETGDAIAMYVNYAEMLDVFNIIANMEDCEDEFNSAQRFMDELGLSGIGKAAARWGFSGSDMVINHFVEMSAPRKGVFANINTIELSMLDMVDSRAMSVASVNFNFAGMYDTIMNAFKIASPNEAYPEIQQALAKFESQAKFSVRKDLLGSLSGQIVCYTLPAGLIMEAPSGGVVLVAELKNPALFEKSMVGLGEFAATNSNGMLQINTQAQDNKKVHIWGIMPLAVMQIMPTWAIVDNHIVAATNPALHKIAIAQMQSGTNSIRSTKGYKKVTAKLPDNLAYVRYTDSQVQFNQMMMGIQQFWPMVTMGATEAGIKLPFMLPSLSHIAEKMEPSCAYSRLDSKGLHIHYQGTGVEQSIMGSIAGVSVAAAIIMPAMSKVSHQAQLITSATNLSAIGRGIMIYANENNDKYPDNLQELIEIADLPPKTLESPRKPKGFDGPSYIYITGQSPNSYSYNILAYENPAFCSDKINVLFIDSHVQAMKLEEFAKELKATYERLDREIPEIKIEDSIGIVSSNEFWSLEAKAWAIGCAAVLNERNHCRHDTLLPCDKNERNIESWKKSLDRWWEVKNRNDLFDSLRWIEEGGHRRRFDDWGKYIQTLDEEQYQNLVKEKSSDEEKLCEILIAKKYYEKLGEKSLLGWDFSRYICLCRWGCLVGYISEDEAWERIMPVAEMLQEKFDSWEELGQNYIIGRQFWSHKYTAERGDLYEDAFQRLLDMRSSPWNKYPWDMDLTAKPIINDPNKQAK